jgi:hypothetical protein
MRIVYCKPDEDNTSILKEKYTMKKIRTKSLEDAKKNENVADSV